MRVSPVAREKTMRRFDRLEQVEGTNRTARSKRLFSVARDDDCGAVITLDTPRSRNAEDAAMPAFAIHHDAVSLAQRRLAADPLFHRSQDSPLFFLPVGVEPVKLAGQLPGAKRVLHAEELDHVASHIHAPGGVDAGSNAECNFS